MNSKLTKLYVVMVKCVTIKYPSPFALIVLALKMLPVYRSIVQKFQFLFFYLMHQFYPSSILDFRPINTSESQASSTHVDFNGFTFLWPFLLSNRNSK